MRCAVRAAFSGAHRHCDSRDNERSFRPLNADGDIAARLSLPSHCESLPARGIANRRAVWNDCPDHA